MTKDLFEGVKAPKDDNTEREARPMRTQAAAETTGNGTSSGAKRGVPAARLWGWAAPLLLVVAVVVLWSVSIWLLIAVAIAAAVGLVITALARMWQRRRSGGMWRRKGASTTAPTAVGALGRRGGSRAARPSSARKNPGSGRLSRSRMNPANMFGGRRGTGGNSTSASRGRGGNGSTGRGRGGRTGLGSPLGLGGARRSRRQGPPASAARAGSGRAPSGSRWSRSRMNPATWRGGKTAGKSGGNGGGSPRTGRQGTTSARSGGGGASPARRSRWNPKSWTPKRWHASKPASKGAESSKGNGKTEGAKNSGDKGGKGTGGAKRRFNPMSWRGGKTAGKEGKNGQDTKGGKTKGKDTAEAADGKGTKGTSGKGGSQQAPRSSRRDAAKGDRLRDRAAAHGKHKAARKAKVDSPDRPKAAETRTGPPGWGKRSEVATAGNTKVESPSAVSQSMKTASSAPSQATKHQVNNSQPTRRRVQMATTDRVENPYVDMIDTSSDTSFRQSVGAVASKARRDAAVREEEASELRRQAAALEEKNIDASELRREASLLDEDAANRKMIAATYEKN